MDEKKQVPYSTLQSEVYNLEEEEDPISQRDTDPAPPPEEEPSPESDGKPSIQVKISREGDDGLD